MDKTLLEQLEDLINLNSLENSSGTPDFILARYLHDCLQTYNTALQARERWYGRSVKAPQLATDATFVTEPTSERLTPQGDS